MRLCGALTSEIRLSAFSAIAIASSGVRRPSTVIEVGFMLSCISGIGSLYEHENNKGSDVRNVISLFINGVIDKICVL